MKCINRASVYWRERVGREVAGLTVLRGNARTERWRHFCQGHPLEGSFREGASYHRQIEIDS